MKQLIANLDHIAVNPHVSVPAVVGAGLGIAAIIWPQYADKFAAIIVVLNSYGLLAAANTPTAKQNAPQ